MSAADLLASLGIEAGVGQPPIPVSTMDTTCPTDILATLSTATAIPWFLLFGLTFWLRKILLPYVRDRFIQICLHRTNFRIELEYRVIEGGDMTSVTIMTSGPTRPLEQVELVRLTNAEEPLVEEELSEVVVS